MAATTGAGSDEIEGPTALRVRIFELIQGMQSGEDGAAEAIARITALAERSGFDRVVRAGLYGRAVETWMSQDGGLADALDALIGRSRLDGDGAMVALGLGMKAAFLSGPEGEMASPEYDGDLAEAAVLLRAADGPALERISAHTSCGIAFDYRSLWELADEQYAAALRLGDRAEPGVVGTLLAAVMFNRAEAHVSWAGRLRQVGDAKGVAERWSAWQAVSAMPPGVELPFLWRSELWALGQLMAAIAGLDVSREVGQRLAEMSATGSAESRARGHLILADALSAFSSRRPDTAAKSDAALAAIDPDIFPQMHDLCLFLAAQVEAGGGQNAGLRCAQHHIKHRAGDRLAHLGAMISRIERAQLQQQLESLSEAANLDHLTGIANRRALATYSADLVSRRVEKVAVVMVDVDEFKLVNDGHGHNVGDQVLVRIASVLHQSVRPVDIAARLGGDEFLVVIANADAGVALQRAEAILSQIARQPWDELSEGLTVSVSIGVAAGDSAALETVRGNADRAAYYAKRKPGNWIACHSSGLSA
jgi:diguanylate cyclase (GGDEF)-like protein